MRVARKRRNVVDVRKGDIGFRKLLPQPLGVERAGNGGNSAIRLGTALDPGEVGGKVGIGREIGIAQYFLRQYPPFAVVLYGDENPLPVAGREHAVRRDGGMCEPDTLRRLARFLLNERNRHPVGDGVEHRNRKLGTLAGALSRNQSFQDRFVSIHSGSDIDDRNANARRFRRAGDRGEPHFRLNEQIVGLAHRVWPSLAKAGNRATDEPRIVAPQPRNQESRAWLLRLV